MKALLSLAAVGVLVAGCASSGPVAHRVAYPDGSRELTMVVSMRPASLLPAKAVAPPMLQVNSQGFATVQTAVASTGRAVSYRWEWVGPDGYLSRTPTGTAWRPLLEDGLARSVLTSTSTVANPTQVVLHFQETNP